MRISLRKVALVLAILTVALMSTTVYAHIDYLREPRSGLLIQASEVDQAPSYGVVITDPHPYLIEAVENPGEPIYVGVRSEETEALYEQVLHGSTYVKYEGKYYGILKGWVDLGLDPSVQQWEVLGFSGLGACWVTVAYTHFRKTKRGVRDEKG